jgi:amino acid adenylation domain-containing protein
MESHNKLHHLLAHSATLYSNRTALICDEQSVNYSELYRSSATVKILLTEAGITAGDRVVLYFEKSIDLVSCLFGILSCEAAYVPLDVNAPVERNRYIIDSCDANFIFTTKQRALSFSDGFVQAGHFNGLILLKRNKSSPTKSPEGLAYILHTSGSTGKPKGVMYSHAGALAFVDWCTQHFSFHSTDRFSSHAPFHFDLSVFDLFVAIKHGAAVILITDKVGKQPLLLSRLISDLKISVWYSTPTILRLLSEYGKLEKYDLSSLRIILFAGEVYPLSLFKDLYHKLNHVKYCNLYGPTETNVCCYYKIKTAASLEENIPIGKVCEHYTGKIANDEPEGELLISGDALMLGYWGANSLTEEKMTKDRDGKLWYKTGDIVATDSSGQLIFKGRIDRMIKRNGYRIELDEIEKTLIAHPLILSCATIAKQSEQFTNKIIAYISPAEELNRSGIFMKALSAEILPMYMIPDEFIFVNEIPMTSGHKTDYQKLITMSP